MRIYKILGLLSILLILLSCSTQDMEDFDIGITSSTCDKKCGDISTCRSTKGDMKEKEKDELSFPFGSVYSDGSSDYPENLETLNITLSLTVEGTGSAKVSLKNAAGDRITGIASAGNPVVITDTVPLKKSKGGDNIIQSAEITGVRVESVDGPATDVQVIITINDCIDNWCTGTHPNCSGN